MEGGKRRVRDQKLLGLMRCTATWALQLPRIIVAQYSAEYPLGMASMAQYLHALGTKVESRGEEAH